jgi:hypothetical protein
MIEMSVVIESPAAIKIAVRIGKMLTPEAAAEALTVEMAGAKAAHMATTETATHTAAAAGETATHMAAAAAEAATHVGAAATAEAAATAAVSSASASSSASATTSTTGKRVNAHDAAESGRRGQYDHGLAQHCTHSFRRDRVHSTNRSRPLACMRQFRSMTWIGT